MTTKQFNLEQFKAGEKVQTKLGNPVKFITVSDRNELIVSVQPRYGLAEQCKYTIDGKKYAGTETAFDLEMVKPYMVLPKRNAKGQFVKRS